MSVCWDFPVRDFKSWQDKKEPELSTIYKYVCINLIFLNFDNGIYVVG